MKILAKIGAGAGAAAVFGTAAISPVCCLCVVSLVLLVTSAGAVYLALQGRHPAAPRRTGRAAHAGERRKEDRAKGGAA